MSYTLPIDGQDKIRLARGLYPSEYFSLVASLLHELEAEAVESLRRPSTTTQAEHCAAIRAVELLRSKFRVVAHEANLGDPFGPYSDS